MSGNTNDVPREAIWYPQPVDEGALRPGGDLPGQAIHLAAEVLFAQMYTVLPEPMTGRELADYLARQVLAAAAPALAAAERERVLLAVRHTCACQNCKDAVASLTGDTQ